MRLMIAATSLFAALTLSAGSALACSCLRPESAAAHARDADLVFKGTPVGQLRGRPGEMVTVFRVSEVLKGRPGGTVEISHRTDSASCGMTFRPGVAVLVLANREAGGSVTTNLCSQPMFSERQYREALAGRGGPQARCEVQRVQFAIGETYTRRLGERALQRSGARSLRIKRPGEVYTMEYRPDRLNLELDRRNRVRGAACG